MAASVLTLAAAPDRVGPPIVALGGLVVLLALVSWFYWAATRSSRRDAAARSARLAALLSENRDLAQQAADAQRARDQLVDLGTANRLLTDELDKARADVTETRDDRDRYEAALRTMAERSRRPVRHELQHIIYMIGETASGDFVTEWYRTMAVHETEPLLWHHVDVGLTNQASTIESFRDLEHTSVFEVVPNPPPPVLDLDYLSTGRRDNRVGVLVFFEPEIGMTPREWRLTYCWPGMWDPLRNRLRDTSFVRLGESRKVHRDVLVVSFVFPFAAVNPRVRLGPSGPNVRPGWKADLSGRRTATFEIRDPGHEDYDWILEIEGFSPRGRR